MLFRSFWGYIKVRPLKSMSSIIFATDAGQALVATDTLAVDLDGNPLLFCSKATYIPHLRTIIAGTGLGSFANNWANEVNNKMIVAGLRNLDYHTPKLLRDRWAKEKEVSGFPESLTTTIYQIGVSEDDEEIRAYAYRSSNDFESEPLEHGTRYKPECALPSDVSLLQALRPMMEEQRRIQGSKPSNERIYIGGQCIFMHLTKDVCTTATLFDFDDYEHQLQAVFKSCTNG